MGQKLQNTYPTAGNPSSDGEKAKPPSSLPTRNDFLRVAAYVRQSSQVGPGKPQFPPQDLPPIGALVQFKHLPTQHLDFTMMTPLEFIRTIRLVLATKMDLRPISVKTPMAKDQDENVINPKGRAIVDFTSLDEARKAAWLLRGEVSQINSSPVGARVQKIAKGQAKIMSDEFTFGWAPEPSDDEDVESIIDADQVIDSIEETIFWMDDVHHSPDRDSEMHDA